LQALNLAETRFILLSQLQRRFDLDTTKNNKIRYSRIPNLPSPPLSLRQTCLARLAGFAEPTAESSGIHTTHTAYH
jgi:hypothetical protein